MYNYFTFYLLFYLLSIIIYLLITYYPYRSMQFLKHTRIHLVCIKYKQLVDWSDIGDDYDDNDLLANIKIAWNEALIYKTVTAINITHVAASFMSFAHRDNIMDEYLGI